MSVRLVSWNKIKIPCLRWSWGVDFFGIVGMKMFAEFFSKSRSWVPWKEEEDLESKVFSVLLKFLDFLVEGYSRPACSNSGTVALLDKGPNIPIPVLIYPHVSDSFTGLVSLSTPRNCLQLKFISCVPKSSANSTVHTSKTHTHIHTRTHTHTHTSLLSPAMCVRVCVCVLSHVWLFTTPLTIAQQAILSMEFSRQEY